MFDDLLFFYKNSVLLKRLMVCAFLGLLPGVYVYFDGIEMVEAESEAATAGEATAAAQLETVTKQIEILPSLTAQLEKTREQLKIAEARLPDKVQIDQVLRTVGVTVKPAGAEVINFTPQAQVVRGDVYKYVEVPVKIEVEAKEYAQICEWLDSVAGESKLMYLNSWSISARAGKPSDSGSIVQNQSAAPGLPSDASQRGMASREGLRLKFMGDFSLYRLATSSEISAPVASTNPKDTVPPKAPPPAVEEPKSEGAGAVDSEDKLKNPDAKTQTLNSLPSTDREV